MPTVTVLMPVYNGERHLRDSIDSILAQTYRDFEFLIVDDGSTDRSAATVRSYADPRIRFVQNSENLNLSATLNRGLDLAVGDYVARLDADDLAMPDRLASQVRFLETHPRVGIVGSWAVDFGSGKSRVRCMPTDSASVACANLFGCSLIHPSVTMRRAALNAHSLRYDARDWPAEDYGLWLRASRCFLLANLPQALLRYRVHESSMTHVHREQMRRSTRSIQSQHFRACGLEVSDAELAVHQEVSGIAPELGVSSLDAVRSWLMKLENFNRTHKVWPEPAFRRRLGNRWLWSCLVARNLNPVEKLRAFLDSRFAIPCLAGELQRLCEHPGLELRAAMEAFGLTSPPR